MRKIKLCLLVIVVLIASVYVYRSYRSGLIVGEELLSNQANQVEGIKEPPVVGVSEKPIGPKIVELTETPLEFDRYEDELISFNFPKGWESLVEKDEKGIGKIRISSPNHMSLSIDRRNGYDPLITVADDSFENAGFHSKLAVSFSDWSAELGTVGGGHLSAPSVQIENFFLSDKDTLVPLIKTNSYLLIIPHEAGTVGYGQFVLNEYEGDYVGYTRSLYGKNGVGHVDSEGNWLLGNYIYPSMYFSCDTYSRDANGKQIAEKDYDTCAKFIDEFFASVKSKSQASSKDYERISKQDFSIAIEELGKQLDSNDYSYIELYNRASGYDSSVEFDLAIDFQKNNLKIEPKYHGDVPMQVNAVDEINLSTDGCLVSYEEELNPEYRENYEMSYCTSAFWYSEQVGFKEPIKEIFDSIGHYKEYDSIAEVELSYWSRDLIRGNKELVEYTVYYDFISSEKKRLSEFFSMPKVYADLGLDFPVIEKFAIIQDTNELAYIELDRMYEYIEYSIKKME
ncbi:hypothetical protein KC717_03055 [Candidatus Dojkabacteria bacterium]|uniref:Uncharacterized protein n=1 Tax=Candidatus Dojkabacteria bacterium TaxID=2099670 RepID=A0A955RKA8_9BACT|nr:hypothetical protein [Candidatus Dojkabacteria bacterium]